MKRVSGFIIDQLKYLFAGLVSWLPIGLLVFVIGYVVGLLESVGHNFFGFFLPPQAVFPGIGIVFWIVVFYLTGLIINITSVGRYISRVPIVGMFFSKSGEAMTLDRLAKLTPCIFLYSPTCVAYGWILWEQKVKPSDEASGFNLITVYYPNVPTILSGQVYSARKETVIRLGNSSQEVLNMLLYGLKKPEYIKFLPWDDENEGDFRQRILKFGITEIHDQN